MHRFISSLVAAGLLVGLVATSVAATPDLTVTNPEGTLRFTLQVQDGTAAYTVERCEGATTVPVLEPSPLGFTRTDADFAGGLAFVAASEARPVEDRYTLVAGRQRQIYSRGIERTFTLRNATGMTLTLTVRAYRDGVAFRYGLPGAGSQLLRIGSEATGFNLPDDARLWAQPYSAVAVWAPGYEADYVNGVPAGTPAPAEQGWALPLLFRAGGTWALITESALEPTYFASHLQPQAPGGLYRVRLPEAEETYGVAPQEAAFTLPWVSPWRVVIVGSSPGAISDSTLVTDLARPNELADTSWIKPGVASWSWWSDMSSPSDYAKVVPFVDAAARFHWPYSLVDLGWHQMQGGDIKQLADYAAQKQVGLIVWYNSAGRHNQVPDAGPRDVMNDPLRRDAEFARLAALGIKGIKVDFMQSDKQFVIALYHDILRDAARHHLLVNFHGATIPRGWNRTYPHLLTMEAVRGGEQYWDKSFAEQAQTFHTIYAFTRNAVGPMDYTPTVLTDPGASNPGLQPHLTTSAHELALLVVFQSGMQHVIDPAASLVRQPVFVQDYLTDLPTAWDESHCLAGTPGELAVFARRSGSTWYVAGINGLKTPQTIQVPLAFLGAGRFDLALITDGAKPSELTHTARLATAGETLALRLAGRGGFVAKLVATFEPVATTLVDEGQGRVLATTADFPGVVPEGFAGNGRFVRAAPAAALKAFFHVWYRAVACVTDPAHAAEVAKLASETTLNGTATYTAEELPGELAKTPLHSARQAIVNNTQGGNLQVYYNRCLASLIKSGRRNPAFNPKGALFTGPLLNAAARVEGLK